MTRTVAIAAMLMAAAVLALAPLDAASARKKKLRLKAPETRQQVQQEPRAVMPGIMRDDGTPIIMQGYNPPRYRRDTSTPSANDEPGKRVDRPAVTRRGSSTYIPPPVPSPSGGPPAQALTHPGPGVYQPPKINSFGDRATGCLHSYPMAIGQPGVTDRDSFVRGCAN